MRSLDEIFSRNQMIEFRLTDRAAWQPGYVDVALAEEVRVRPQRGTRVFTIAPGAGRGGIRALEGRRLILAQQAAAAPAPRRSSLRRRPPARAAAAPVPVAVRGGAAVSATERRHTQREVLEPAPARLSPALAAAPELRLVRSGPAELRADPRPRPRARCADFLAFVRRMACCACWAPGPSDGHHVGPRGVGQRADDFGAVPLCRPCHRAVTDTHRLPGRDGPTTELVILRASVQVLIEWAILREAGVPVLLDDEGEHTTQPRPSAPHQELLCHRSEHPADWEAQHAALRAGADWVNPALVGEHRPQVSGGRIVGEHAVCRGCGSHLFRELPHGGAPPALVAARTLRGGSLATTEGC